MANWQLHCAICNWAPESTAPMSDVETHWLAHSEGERAPFDQVALNLVPRCPDDDAAFDLSESGDSGQCPTCGRFEILRVPEEYR